MMLVGDNSDNLLFGDNESDWLFGAGGNDVSSGASGVGPSVDVHGFAFDSSGRLLAATEAGIYRLSTVQPGGGRNWTSLNGTPGLSALNTVTVAGLGLATNRMRTRARFVSDCRARCRY